MKKKKIILILIAIFTCICLVGCETKKDEDNKENTENTLKISLYDNSSTGYVWSYNVSENDIIEISESSDYSNCDPEAAGCGGKKIYTIKALKPGKTTLSLDYTSIANGKTDKIAIYEITVDQKLNITETHSGSYFE